LWWLFIFFNLEEPFDCIDHGILLVKLELYVITDRTYSLVKSYLENRFQRIVYTWVRASWIEFNNCPTRCDLFSLLYFCRQLYMFRV